MGTCETADALRDALERKAWQLVISDSSMPQLTALDALTLTKQLSPEVPFIVVSGTMTEEVAMMAMRSGAADFVTKERLERLGPAVTRELAPSRRAEARELSRRLLAAQEAEARRIARTLHDQLGQLLTALELTLKSAQKAKEPRATPSCNGRSSCCARRCSRREICRSSCGRRCSTIWAWARRCAVWPNATRSGRRST